ncbi:MAG: 4Fe-4S dicluster domain-containing protein [Desulfobacteraceae bacterium]|nr:MAG: 4Fe-4S dicluster domain-containing protein [Desulfobacteraceae bacterium]
MKTFFNLIQEVQKPGLCHRCGGCVTFCTAINYGALKIDDDGKPCYGEIEKCIECGLCYVICPEIDELEEEIRRRAAWSEPMGRVIETAVMRTTDAALLGRATDGGVVTALLLHLFDRGRIDGAIVTKQVGPFQRAPYLATSREEILSAAGFFFDTSHGMKQFSEQYMTYSSIEEFDPMIKKGLKRVALVGTPCQINSVRRMQALELLPADSIKICLGLFCSGNFVFGAQERAKLAKLGGFSWDDVRKVNIKDVLMLHLSSGDIKRIELEDLFSIRRYACQFCADYANEYADISFGGIGAPEGWTTVIARTPLGRGSLADGKCAGIIEEYNYQDNPSYVTDASNQVRTWSAKKKKSARHTRRGLSGGPVAFNV